MAFKISGNNEASVINIPRAMLSPSAPPMELVKNLSYTRPEVIPLPAPQPPARLASPQRTVNINDTNASGSSQPQVVYIVGPQNEKEEMDWCTERGLYFLWRVMGTILVVVIGLIIYIVVKAVK